MKSCQYWKVNVSLCALSHYERNPLFLMLTSSLRAKARYNPTTYLSLNSLYSFIYYYFLSALLPPLLCFARGEQRCHTYYLLYYEYDVVEEACTHLFIIHGATRRKAPLFSCNIELQSTPCSCSFTCYDKHLQKCMIIIPHNGIDS